MKTFEDLLKQCSPNDEVGFSADLKKDMRVYRFVCNLAERYANYKAEIAWEEGRNSHEVFKDEIKKLSAEKEGIYISSFELAEKWKELMKKSETNPYKTNKDDKI